MSKLTQLLTDHNVIISFSPEYIEYSWDGGEDYREVRVKSDTSLNYLFELISRDINLREKPF